MSGLEPTSTYSNPIATERIRAMLDERGVEWHDTKIGKGFITVYEHDGITWIVTEHSSGRLSVKGCVKPTQGHYDGMTPEQAIAATLGPKITGNTSDGYHTFNELYHHRAVLFSVIVRDHRELAWKSMRHHDGTMYDGMFIVGIETPEGQATYHYDIDPYWDMFNCRELDQAPEWDGHTPSEAIERIATLGSCNCSDNCTNSERMTEHGGPERSGEYVTVWRDHKPTKLHWGVPVVRCRDCEYYRDHEWMMVTDVVDVCHFFADGVKVEPDGFCAWGRLKEEQ